MTQIPTETDGPLNAAQSGIDAGLSIIAEPAALVRPIDARTLRKALGTGLYDRLSPWKRRNVAAKLRILGGWQKYRRAARVEHGRAETAMRGFLEVVRRQVGRRVTARTVRRWRRRYAQAGIPGLVDRRRAPRERGNVAKTSDGTKMKPHSKAHRTRPRRRLPSAVPFAPTSYGADQATLVNLLGAELFNEMSPRQRERVARQLEIVDGWYRYAAAASIRHGCIGRATSAYTRAAAIWWGRPLDSRRLREWIGKLEGSDARLLVDWRGRTGRPRAQVDVGLLTEFADLVRQGVSQRKADGQIRERAERESRLWPSLRTVRQRYQAAARNGYLFKGQIQN